MLLSAPEKGPVFLAHKVIMLATAVEDEDVRGNGTTFDQPYFISGSFSFTFAFSTNKHSNAAADDCHGVVRFICVSLKWCFPR